MNEHTNPDGTQRIVGHTPDEIKKICRGHGQSDRVEELLCTIEEEFTQGFAFAKDHPEAVTIFGSARTNETDFYYQKAVEVGRKIVAELGLAVVTGGGPGIMEAGNKGASEAGGHSLAMTIKLPIEQTVNSFATEAMHFKFFFTRKVIMAYSAKAFILFPGGFGTLNELFEILTLVQTKKIPAAPIILFGVEFWEPLQSYIENYLSERGLVDEEDPHVYYIITDNENDVIQNITTFYNN